MTELEPVGGGELDTVPQLVVGTLVPRPGECSECGRGPVQHGRFTCEQIDQIAARVAYYRLPLRLRLRTRRPR